MIQRSTEITRSCWQAGQEVACGRRRRVGRESVIPSPHRGQAPFSEWRVCSSAQRRRAVRRLIPSAPRAHGAWGGTRATRGATINPAASAIAVRRARHPALRACIRASAGTSSNPKRVMRAGTETPGGKDSSDSSGFSAIVIPVGRKNLGAGFRPPPGSPAVCRTRSGRGIVRARGGSRNWTLARARPVRPSPGPWRKHGPARR